MRYLRPMQWKGKRRNGRRREAGSGGEKNPAITADKSFFKILLLNRKGRFEKVGDGRGLEIVSNKISILKGGCCPLFQSASSFLTSSYLLLSLSLLCQNWFIYFCEYLSLRPGFSECIPSTLFLRNSIGRNPVEKNPYFTLHQFVSFDSTSLVHGAFFFFFFGITKFVLTIIWMLSCFFFKFSHFFSFRFYLQT